MVDILWMLYTHSFCFDHLQLKPLGVFTISLMQNSKMHGCQCNKKMDDEDSQQLDKFSAARRILRMQLLNLVEISLQPPKLSNFFNIKTCLNQPNSERREWNHHWAWIAFSQATRTPVSWKAKISITFWEFLHYCWFHSETFWRYLRNITKCVVQTTFTLMVVEV